MRRHRCRALAALVTVGAAWLFGGAGTSAAADLPRPDEATDYLVPDRIADAHPRWAVVHQDEAALVGDTFVWPAVTVGGIYETNPFHLHRPSGGVGGVEVSPHMLVEHDSGLHRTEGYAFGDLRAFPSASGADSVEGRAGVLHDWLVRPDLTVRLQGEVDRHTDPFDTTALPGLGEHRGLIFENDLLGAASIQKTFERAFVVLSGTALHATFDSQSSLSAHRVSDETIAAARLRVGYVLPSSVYVFAEPSLNERSLDAVGGTATGERVVAGVGVGRFGLLGGEVFGGYQHQADTRPAATAAAPVIGGRLAWSPNPAWSIAAELDEDLGQVAVATRYDALGTLTRTTTGLASVAYALSPLWRGQAEAGATWIAYQDTIRTDRLAFADVRLDYALSRSFDLTGLLRVSALQSSLAVAGYSSAAATLAATYHY